MDILELRIAGYKIIRSFPILFFVFLLLPSQKATAVGGISNSKVIVPSAETVPFKRFEIEPFFGLVFIDDSDTTIGFEGGTRFTLGVLNDLEIGTNLGYLSVEDSDVIRTESNFGNIAFGMKYRFIDQGQQFPFSLAYQGGITVPTSTSDDKWIFEPFGLILTKDFSESFSMDADVVLALVENESVGFVADIGFGYFIRPWLQPVIEAGFSFEDPDGEESISVLNVTAGFTSPVNEMLTIIIGVTPDVYTRNTDNEILISAAFTFLF
ncbi:transporter [Desulfobacterota bacterium AH_259_B03_O07]|nr:transporter [Desulfobacterota bacterium AH_259_B03_O07]